MTDQVSSSLDELLDNIGKSDPKLGVLVDFIRKKNAEHVIEEAENEKTRKRTELKNIQIERDYQILYKRNNLLAQALGACGECWGTEEGCQCGGKGSVGSQFPNKELFSELVVPVLEKYGKSLAIAW